MKKFYSENTLLNQNFIMDPDKTIKEIINDFSQTNKFEIISYDLISLGTFNDRYKIIEFFLKISGESLMGESNYGLNVATTKFIAQEIKNIYNNGQKFVLLLVEEIFIVVLKVLQKELIDLLLIIWECLLL